jgi:hypothetical protein
MSCSALLICSVADGSELAKKGSPKVQTTPLKALDTVPATKGSFLAWIEPVKSDDKGNAYFLVLPEIRRQTDPTAEVPRPRDVLRISADGKKRSTLSPIKSSKLATATTVTTAGIALDPDGGLSMLVWARWRDSNGGEEKRGQYIVSFDKEGDYRSEVEVDWRELGVMQFEAFGSGKFLLRGRRTNADEMRLAILSATGSLTDVVDWSEHSSEVPELNERSTPTRRPAFGQMVRGGDGRIYVTQPGERPAETVVYAVSASGESERVYTLRPMPGDLPLVGMKAAGDRLAAVYLEHGGESGRWWIAIYGNVASDLASPLAVYGPAPGVPISYRQEESGDRFTFLKGGNFMTMSSP